MIGKCRLSALAVVLAGIVWIALSVEKPIAKPALTVPVIYGQDDVTHYLRKHGIDVEVVSNVRRNGSGTEIFIYLFDSLANGFSVINITTNGLVHLEAPGHDAVPGADGNFVAWGSEAGKGIRFQNAELLQLPRHALFAIDPGGTYFIVGEKPHKAWLGRVRSPLDKCEIADDLLPGGVFVSGGRIYVTGHSSSGDSSGRAEGQTMCLILRDEGEDFKIVERLTFDWAAGIVEVDPFADRLLLLDKALVSHSVYSYDLTTKQRDRIGRADNFQFFLVTDFLR